MSTLKSIYKECSENEVVQFISLRKGDILEFKGCDIILADYTEVGENGEVLNEYTNKPVVVFTDGLTVGLSKLTTHFVNNEPVSTVIGEQVRARLKKDVVKQLRKLPNYTVVNVREVTTKNGSTTKEYDFEEVK